jgi:hypothetical protein
MPMAGFQAKVAGHEGQIFAHLPFNPEKDADRFAADGVSCSLCHQITKDKLKTADATPFQTRASTNRCVETPEIGWRPRFSI